MERTKTRRLPGLRTARLVLAPVLLGLLGGWAGIQLAPGEFFMLGEPDAVWFRFNVAYAADPQLLRFLQSIR